MDSFSVSSLSSILFPNSEKAQALGSCSCVFCLTGSSRQKAQRPSSLSLCSLAAPTHPLSVRNISKPKMVGKGRKRRHFNFTLGFFILLTHCMQCYGCLLCASHTFLHSHVSSTFEQCVFYQTATVAKRNKSQNGRNGLRRMRVPLPYYSVSCALEGVLFTSICRKGSLIPCCPCTAVKYKPDAQLLILQLRRVT